MAQFDLTVKLTDARLRQFAEVLIEMQSKLSFKISARGWCYMLEQSRWINKNQFDKVENAINESRKRGYLPVDFVAEETARAFSGVERPDSGHPKDNAKWLIEHTLEGWRQFTPDWWEGEDFYIQVVVEKIDLKTLFEPICHRFHIPIANAKGWSSVLQRAEYARRFKQAEDMGLKCVLLYCGDHDPDGLRISETLRKNLEDVRNIVWDDGETGYDPADLIIERFGLNYDFIELHGLTWIDNLITGSGKDLASRTHPNHRLPYVQEYLGTIGERKCEANAIVVIPRQAQGLMQAKIEEYLGDNALARFSQKRQVTIEQYEEFLDESGVGPALRRALDLFE